MSCGQRSLKATVLQDGRFLGLTEFSSGLEIFTDWNMGWGSVF